MLKEICITPQTFNNQYINDSNGKDLKSLLENIKISGYILGIQNSDWYKETIENINKIESQKIRDHLFRLLNTLKDMGKICGHPKNKIATCSEKDWVEIAEDLNKIKKISSIIAIKAYYSNIIELNSLEDINIPETFGFTGSKHTIKDKDSLENIFLDLLSYARKVTIIDPHFDICEDRYKSTLNLVAKTFRKRRGKREKGSIVIHCKLKNKHDEYHLKKWQKEIDKIFKECGHIVSFNLWESEKIKLHERYIITNNSGIVLGAGTDEDDYQQSECSIKEYDEREEILKQYDEGAGVFSLKYKINKSKIQKIYEN